MGVDWRLIRERKAKATEPMEKVCAWCQKEKGQASKPGQTHGICQRHRDELLAEMEEMQDAKQAENL